VPIGGEALSRTLGQLRGELTVADDFEAPLPWEEWLHDPGSSGATEP
jgi:hypothetical protein